MIKMENRTENIKIKISEMPFYHRRGAENNKTYVQLGKVKQGGNEPYCFPQEKQCEGHICRVLIPENAIDRVNVIREDGTIWDILLSNFVTWSLIEIV